MPESLSRNALLVKYFAQVYHAHHRVGVPRKNLVKYIYEADVLSREYLGRAISTFEYKYDKYGPYDAAIEEAIGELEAAGHVDQKRDRWYGAWLQGAYQRLIDRQRPVAFGFDAAESAVLNYVVTNYVPMEFDEFLRTVIYETAPMKAGTRKGERLPMALCNNTGTRKVGFKLKDVLGAEEAAKRGETISLGDFLHGLRNPA